MSASDPVPCDFCGIPIASEKFAQGKAIVILKKRYCAKCMQKAVQRAKTPAPAPSVPPPLPAEAATKAAPPAPTAALKRTRRLTVGEHGCGLYASEDERRAQMIPFVKEGLLNGQRLLYFLDKPTPERILGDFNAAGFSAQTLLQKGQLQVLSASKLREARGGLDTQDVIARMAQSVEKAVGQGYEGLRILCDMTWALSSLLDSDRLIDFEIQLASLAASGRCAALCQYNVYRFELGPLHQIRKNHAVLLAKGMAETMLKELVGTS
jgi:MEDS: MEthanogen/methylotroph, DcmR Sensory domain